MNSFCSKCGAEVTPKDSLYCSHCGAETSLSLSAMDEVRKNVAELNRLSKEKAEREGVIRAEKILNVDSNRTKGNNLVIAMNKRKWYLIVPYIFFVLTYACYYLWQYGLKSSLPQNNLSMGQWLVVVLLLLPAVINFVMYIFSLFSTFSIIYSMIMPIFKILIYIPIIGWLIWIGIFFGISLFLNSFAAPAFFGDFIWSRKYKQLSLRKSVKMAKQQIKNSY